MFFFQLYDVFISTMPAIERCDTLFGAAWCMCTHCLVQNKVNAFHNIQAVSQAVSQSTKGASVPLKCLGLSQRFPLYIHSLAGTIFNF